MIRHEKDQKMGDPPRPLLTLPPKTEEERLRGLKFVKVSWPKKPRAERWTFTPSGSLILVYVIRALAGLDKLVRATVYNL